MPSQGINPLQLGPDALFEVLQGFYRAFPAHPEEARYKYSLPSTMKPTQMRCPPGGLNQVPSKCVISGDVRLTPFYAMEDVVREMKKVVAEVNARIAAGGLRSWHASSRYAGVDGDAGRIEIEFEDPAQSPVGVACDIDSRGFAGLCSAISSVKGAAFTKPYSLTGSLPLVAEMKEQGFDIQITGFGLMKYYHKADEACSMKDMRHATKILSAFVSKVAADMAGGA
jgi:acetylornithine deacetylase